VAAVFVDAAPDIVNGHGPGEGGAAGHRGGRSQIWGKAGKAG
jgi:hypothetical protein